MKVLQLFNNSNFVQICDNAGKTHGSGELTKSKSMKSSFKGKVTSLFLWRNKKPSRQKCCESQSKNESQSIVIEASDSPVIVYLLEQLFRIFCYCWNGETNENLTWLWTSLDCNCYLINNRTSFCHSAFIMLYVLIY